MFVAQAIAEYILHHVFLLAKWLNIDLISMVLKLAWAWSKLSYKFVKCMEFIMVMIFKLPDRYFALRCLHGKKPVLTTDGQAINIIDAYTESKCITQRFKLFLRLWWEHSQDKTSNYNSFDFDKYVRMFSANVLNCSFKLNDDPIQRVVFYLNKAHQAIRIVDSEDIELLFNMVTFDKLQSYGTKLVEDVVLNMPNLYDELDEKEEHRSEEHRSEELDQLAELDQQEPLNENDQLAEPLNENDHQPEESDEKNQLAELDQQEPLNESTDQLESSQNIQSETSPTEQTLEVGKMQLDQAVVLREEHNEEQEEYNEVLDKEQEEQEEQEEHNEELDKEQEEQITPDTPLTPIQTNKITLTVDVEEQPDVTIITEDYPLQYKRRNRLLKKQ